MMRGMSRADKKNSFVLLTGRANPELSQKISTRLNKQIFESVSVFADGEIRVKIPSNLRRRHVFIIQPTCPPVNDHLMELVFMIDAAKRSSAREVTAVVPYFGYARQDRKEMPHVPISASVVAGMIMNAGADRIVTIDIHSEQQQGFIKGPWDNLYGSYSLVPALKKKNLKNLVVASPDKSGMTRALGYARRLGAEDIAVVYKERDVSMSNKSEALDMIGKVTDKNVVIVDDMIDTGGTIVNAANFLKKNGAKSIRVITTHGLFSADSLARIDKSQIDEVITTDTINHRKEVRVHKKITIVSVAPLLAEAVKRIETGESISKDLIL